MFWRLHQLLWQILCCAAFNVMRSPTCQRVKASPMEMSQPQLQLLFLPIPSPPAPLCDVPSGCCFFTGPWTATRSSLRTLRRVAAFCWQLPAPPPPQRSKQKVPPPKH